MAVVSSVVYFARWELRLQGYPPKQIRLPQLQGASTIPRGPEQAALAKSLALHVWPGPTASFLLHEDLWGIVSISEITTNDGCDL